MDLIIFGIQGSGKGTVSKALAEKYHMQIFETGAELRKLAKSDSELGKKIKAIIDAGELVSDEVVMEIVENYLTNEANLEQGIIFDGIPRKEKQAQMLNDLLNKHNREFIAMILKISEETAMERLLKRAELEGRTDDTKEIIHRRIENFHEQTIPAIELYQDKLITIDGEPSITEVRETVFKTLDEYLSN